MSKLTDLLTMHQHCKGICSAQTLAELLPAHDAEIREQAMREQYETDRKAACVRCRKPEPSHAFPIVGRWMHNDGVPCTAKNIRAAWAKAREPQGGKNASEVAPKSA